jgi:hypothetical protein
MNTQAWESRCSVTCANVLGKGKACSNGFLPRRTLRKQSLWGYVSVKLTPEICINKASSNSRMTAAGKWAAPSESHWQNGLQTLSFSPLLLMKQQPNYTCMLKTLLKIYCIWTWDILWYFSTCCCFVWFGLGFFPFDETTTELLLRHHLQDWRQRD